MTRPARTYTMSGDTYSVRDTANGSRIVRSSAGWIVRVDQTLPPTMPAKRADLYTVTLARMIYRDRSRGQTLPAPWGRVIKYGGPQCLKK